MTSWMRSLASTGEAPRTDGRSEPDTLTLGHSAAECGSSTCSAEESSSSPEEETSGSVVSRLLLLSSSHTAILSGRARTRERGEIFFEAKFQISKSVPRGGLGRRERREPPRWSPATMSLGESRRSCRSASSVSSPRFSKAGRRLLQAEGRRRPKLRAPRPKARAVCSGRGTRSHNETRTR